MNEAMNEASNPQDRRPLTDVEIREYLMSDPEVRQRVAEGMERIRRHHDQGPLMTYEELCDYLRGLDR